MNTRNLRLADSISMRITARYFDNESPTNAASRIQQNACDSSCIDENGMWNFIFSSPADHRNTVHIIWRMKESAKLGEMWEKNAEFASSCNMEWRNKHGAVVDMRTNTVGIELRNGERERILPFRQMYIRGCVWLNKGRRVVAYMLMLGMEGIGNNFPLLHKSPCRVVDKQNRFECMNNKIKANNGIF